ncbi:sodium/proton antiporter NhaB [Pantoea sp. SoEX]|uniref:sodium/proton antiporter NhaB n=1 Tax=Pantoea sp. SoEX TaxID=2576763 RepID=UPI0013579F93|nr:sodium/proton antiporter NhaB [Pantoea sp. SoEX]MXP50928.1 sodium/proton antiporter NhaB [Pantoea sp. SoEX]
MPARYLNIITKNFLGGSPNWYKLLIVFFLIINPIFYLYINSYVASWLLLIEFIFTLSMSLKCYPLLPGGLLSLEAIIIGMSSAERVKFELYNNIEVLLLLIFMVSGIFFVKKLLLFYFTRLILSINSKVKLSLVFCITSSLLSAFMDALTVLAVIITVFISLYNKCKQIIVDNNLLPEDKEKNLKQFRSFLRSLAMHSGIGTTLGGIMTMVGEPQNLIIAHSANWNFSEFFLRMFPISVLVFISGIFTVFTVEKFKLFGYGTTIPSSINNILKDFYGKSLIKITIEDKIKLITQGLIIIWLLIALIFRFSEAGFIGLSIIILSTSFLGITNEKDISNAFTETLPFASLLILFCAITAVIHDQKIFLPIMNFILHSDAKIKWLFIFNGLLSSIADNVFIGSVYINELKQALENGIINHNQFELLAIVVNVGTNVPSIATPNGQASFLFLLTSHLSFLINLSYQRMIWMALPFSLILSIVAFCSIKFLLSSYTDFLINKGWILSGHY